MTAPALVLFDVDGTLVDSQAHIVGALTAMYAAGGREVPARERLLSIVGLSLPVAVATLEPDLATDEVERWVDAYRAAFVDARLAGVPSPLYHGAREAMDALRAAPGVLIGVATGKSRRGLAHVFEAHGLGSHFTSTQTADEHPSKPNPAMVEAALEETGVAPGRAVIVGDTTFDIEMGRAAGIATIGVTWGYHPPGMLRAAGASAVIASFLDLPRTVARLLGADR